MHEVRCVMHFWNACKAQGVRGVGNPLLTSGSWENSPLAKQMATDTWSHFVLPSPATRAILLQLKAGETAELLYRV